MARSTPPYQVRGWVIFRAGWHARCRSVQGRPESRGSAIVRGHSSKNHATNHPLFTGEIRKGRGSMLPRPFLQLTGYALGLWRQLTLVTVSEVELGRLTVHVAGRPTEEYGSTL
jgi:hypothetical protein